MPDGAETGGYQPTEGEQEIIDKQMPEGSSKKLASEQREKWHAESGITKQETIEEIAALEKIVDESDTTKKTLKYIGTVKGHEIIITANSESNKVRGMIDGLPMTADQAVALHKSIVAIKEGIPNDEYHIDQIKAKEAFEDIYGK